MDAVGHLIRRINRAWLLALNGIVDPHLAYYINPDEHPCRIDHYPPVCPVAFILSCALHRRTFYERACGESSR